MLKKSGMVLLALAFMLNLSACFYLSSNFFTYLAVQVYLGAVTFVIAMGCIYYRENFKKVWMPIALLSGLFSLLNVVVGVLTGHQVQGLAEQTSSANLLVSAVPMTSLVQMGQVLIVSFIEITLLSFVVMILFNRIANFNLLNGRFK
ncbi:MAG: hypothetical protein ACFN06_03605 [Limosilactobacillus oris]|jgi:hypothetical protein